MCLGQKASHLYYEKDPSKQSAWSFCNFATDLYFMYGNVEASYTNININEAYETFDRSSLLDH